MCNRHAITQLFSQRKERASRLFLRAVAARAIEQMVTSGRDGSDSSAWVERRGCLHAAGSEACERSRCVLPAKVVALVEQRHQRLEDAQLHNFRSREAALTKLSFAI